MSLTENQRQQLIDQVIEQIKHDIQTGDVTAIDELLKFCPDRYLAGYLPDDQNKWNLLLKSEND